MTDFGLRTSDFGLRILFAIAACSKHAPVATCSDDLHGVWRDGAGARWMVLDNDATLEAYPLFPDSVGGDVVGAPRVIDLTRAGERLDGTVHRRFEHRADRCDARAPIHVTACKDDALEVVIADPAAPIDVAPCRWPVAPPSRVERWHRE